jgi:hypothetical protein
VILYEHKTVAVFGAAGFWGYWIVKQPFYGIAPSSKLKDSLSNIEVPIACQSPTIP